MCEQLLKNLLFQPGLYGTRVFFLSTRYIIISRWVGGELGAGVGNDVKLEESCGWNEKYVHNYFFRCSPHCMEPLLVCSFPWAGCCILYYGWLRACMYLRVYYLMRAQLNVKCLLNICEGFLLKSGRCGRDFQACARVCE